MLDPSSILFYLSFYYNVSLYHLSVSSPFISAEFHFHDYKWSSHAPLLLDGRLPAPLHLHYPKLLPPRFWTFHLCHKSREAVKTSWMLCSQTYSSTVRWRWKLNHFFCTLRSHRECYEIQTGINNWSNILKNQIYNTHHSQ